MKILILGATGMLGHALFYYFSRSGRYDVYATETDNCVFEKYFPAEMSKRIITDVDAMRLESVRAAVKLVKPGVVINCIGIIKQLKESKNSVLSISINSLLPHQLAEICSENDARLVHISTDCVFRGDRGNYLDDDYADADDLYGRTKYLGEVDYPNAVTLRTSIIGHELKGRLSLIDWFMSQEGDVKGFTKAIYTGFPTVEFASIIDSYILPDTTLTGVYNVSSDPISKYDLLKIVAQIYKKENNIHPDDSLKIDRSLNSERFRMRTGFRPQTWGEMIKKMHEDYNERKNLYL